MKIFLAARRKIEVIVALFQDFSTQLQEKLAVYATRVNKSVLPYLI